MPEGDTVFRAATRLHEALAGATVARSDFRHPRLAANDLTGYHVVAALSRGKHILIRFGGPKNLTLRSHLRLDGSWRIFGPIKEPPRSIPAHHVRVVLGTDKATAVGVLVQDLDLIPTEQEPRLLAGLGPDLLGADWDPAEAVKRLRAEPARELGQALLDQRNLAGIGNVYKSELCFLRGHSPWTPIGDVDDLAELVDLAHRLLEANAHRGNRTTTGSLRVGETSYVYGRHAAPCRRCATPIRRAGQGERVTYWCPHCQPGPAPGRAAPR
jgi:endonuclease-8